MKIKNHGFTFVELVVVISIFSVILLFSIPLFKDIGLFSGHSHRAASLSFLIESLKLQAVSENTDLFLHIDVDTGLVFVTHGSMDERAMARARQEGRLYKGDVELLNIEFPGTGRSAKSNHTIRFSRKGYSDRALIHLRTDNQKRTLKIGMFLTKVRWYDRYVSYDDCI